MSFMDAECPVCVCVCAHVCVSFMDAECPVCVSFVDAVSCVCVRVCVSFMDAECPVVTFSPAAGVGLVLA